MPVPGLGEALAAFAARRWSWHIDPASVKAVTDVGVGVRNHPPSDPAAFREQFPADVCAHGLRIAGSRLRRRPELPERG